MIAYKLTNIQKKLIEVAKEKGYLTLEDLNAAYASPPTRKACLERFKALGLIKETNVLGKFELIENEETN